MGQPLPNGRHKKSAGLQPTKVSAPRTQDPTDDMRSTVPALLQSTRMLADFPERESGGVSRRADLAAIIRQLLQPSDEHIPSVPRLALSPTEAAEALGVSRSEIYRLMAEGSIRSKKVGRRRLIPVDEARAFLARDLESGAA